MELGIFFICLDLELLINLVSVSVQKPGLFDFGFLENNGAMSKCLYRILHYLISITKLLAKKKSIKLNFILTTRATLTVSSMSAIKVSEFTTSGSFLNFNTRVSSSEFFMTQRLFVIYQMICIASQENFYIIQYSKWIYIKGCIIKCDQIRRKLRIWSHLLRNPLVENFMFFCSVAMQLFSASQIFLRRSNYIIIVAGLIQNLHWENTTEDKVV